MTGARDAGGAATEERIRECLDAVLQQTHGAGPAVSHVTLPIGVMDDVARVLDAALAQRAARLGEAVAGEVERLRAQADIYHLKVSTALADLSTIGNRLAASERALAGARAENERLRQGKDRFKAGVRAAVTWLHARGRTMNDPNARTILDSAADHLGKAMAFQDSRPAGPATDTSPVGIWRGALAAAHPSATDPGPAPAADTGGGHGG